MQIGQLGCFTRRLFFMYNAFDGRVFSDCICVLFCFIVSDGRLFFKYIFVEIKSVKVRSRIVNHGKMKSVMVRSRIVSPQFLFARGFHLSGLETPIGSQVV